MRRPSWNTLSTWVIFSFFLQEGRQIAENPEGNLKTDKTFHKHDGGGKVKGTAFAS